MTNIKVVDLTTGTKYELIKYDVEQSYRSGIKTIELDVFRGDGARFKINYTIGPGSKYKFKLVDEDGGEFYL